MAKLTINQVSIENLGPFRERQNFDLGVSDGRPVILLKALNGSGKTTLLTALQVGLYGYKAVNTARRSEYDQLISGLQRADATGPARIEIQLTVEVGHTVQSLSIRREWYPLEKGIREQFRVFIRNIEDFSMAEEWDEFINGVLPVELVHLFFFDGEKIEALANPERLPALLRRATEVFLGLGGIDTLSTDLKAVERRANKKIISSSSESDQSQVEIYEAELKDLEQRIEMLLQQQAQSRTKLDDAQRKLEHFSVEAQRNGLDAYQKAAELKANLAVCEQEHARARAILVSTMEDPILPLTWLGPLWKRYKVRWEMDHQTKHNHILLEEFAKRDCRILERLAKDAPNLKSLAAELLAADLETMQASKSHVPILLSGENPNDIEYRLEQAKQSFLDAKEAVAITQRAMERAQDAVHQIPAQEQLSAVFEAMQKHTQSVSSAEWDLHEFSREVAEARAKYDHFELRYQAAASRARAELKDNAFHLKALEAADRAKAVLEVFREKLLASKAHWLSEMITTEFKQLLRKRNLISRVVVEADTYSVSIEDAKGHTLPMERLSAGERQILAISVLSALIRERKGRFPVIVDTPLARLDRSHREALVHNFFAKVSHQVMVLSTDEEVEGTVHAALEKHMSREYSLTYDDESRRSVLCANSHQFRLASL